MLDAKTVVRISFLDWLLHQDQDRREQYTAYREYYDGYHDTQLTDRQRAFLEVKTSQEFNDNFCPVVVDALAERLQVTGFTLPGQEAAAALWQWWQQGRMDGVQGQVHTSAVRDGDAYLIVEWDPINNRPRFSAELAYDGTDGVEVLYSSETREPLYAMKYWRVEQESPEDAGYRRRMNVYYPDRIERYQSDERAGGGDWTLIGADVWLDLAGQPLGLPVIHFRNRGQGYNYGQSELVPVVPLQNALNKTLIDLLATADTAAFRIMYMLGDDPSSLDLTPGSILYSLKPSNQVQFGALDGADLTPLIALKDAFAIEIARVTRTPLSMFQISGQRAAEGTLKQEEQGLVSRAKSRHVEFGNAWENAMTLAMRLAETYGIGYSWPDSLGTLSTVWADPQTRDELALLSVLKIKRESLAVPVVKLWAEAGYSPEEIEEMKQSDEYKARTAMQQAAMEMGGPPNGETNTPGQEDDEDTDDEPERA